MLIMKLRNPPGPRSNFKPFLCVIDYRNRVNLNNQVQKEWVHEQISEKEGISESLKSEEQMYA